MKNEVPFNFDVFLVFFKLLNMKNQVPFSFDVLSQLIIWLFIMSITGAVVCCKSKISL